MRGLGGRRGLNYSRRLSFFGSCRLLGFRRWLGRLLSGLLARSLGLRLGLGRRRLDRLNNHECGLGRYRWLWRWFGRQFAGFCFSSCELSGRRRLEGRLGGSGYGHCRQVRHLVWQLFVDADAAPGNAPALRALDRCSRRFACVLGLVGVLANDDLAPPLLECLASDDGAYGA
jgi:hypothetical protein